MKTKCLNCGKEFDLVQLKHDENNLEGFYAECPECGASFDIDFDISQTFITDVAKMADFKVLSKEEFLRSYGYLTEDEYDATKLYLDWLTGHEEQQDVNITEAMCEKIKEAVFIIGPNAIEDLIGCELEFDTDDDLSEAMDNALNQMPEDIIWDFYHKYCCE